MRTQRFAFVPAAALLFVPFAAFLAAEPALGAPHDGRLAIDAACVPVGCFPGDNPGFPVEITSSGSYVLTSDLSVALEPQPETRRAISVGAGAVDLDLGGFTLRGPVDCSGDPLECGATSSFGIGILGQGAASALRIHDGTISGFGGDGILINGDMAILTRLRITDNGARGVAIFGLAPRLSELAVTENAGIGVYLAGDAGSIDNSSAIDNAGGGIQGAAAARIESNAVAIASPSASMISAGIGSRVANNVVRNGFYSIVAAAGSLIHENRVEESVQWEIFLSSTAAYTGNEIYNGSGLFVWGGVSLTQNSCNGSGC